MSKTIFLVLTSAIAIGGDICRKDSLVEVSELEAKNLLARGKARLATAEDGAPERSEDEGQEPAVVESEKSAKAKKPAGKHSEAE